MAQELRTLDQSTWTYEEDGIAGISYLTQIHAAIESCRAFVLIASPKSVKAHQVTREVEQAHEREKVIIAVRLGMTHQEFISSSPILRMACGTAVTLAANEENLPDIAKRIAATLRATDNSNFQTNRTTDEKQPSETSASVAASVRAAAPIGSRVVAQTRASVGNAVPSVDVSRTAAAPTSNDPPDDSSLRLRHPWLQFSVWLGLVIQIVFGGLMTGGYMGDMLLSPGWLKGLVLGAAIALFLCGLLLARSFVRLSRSLGAKAMPQFTPLRQFLMWTVVSGLVFSSAVAYDDGYTALITLLPTVVCFALVRNALRVLRRTTERFNP